MLQAGTIELRNGEDEAMNYRDPSRAMGSSRDRRKWDRIWQVPLRGVYQSVDSEKESYPPHVKCSTRNACRVDRKPRYHNKKCPKQNH